MGVGYRSNDFKKRGKAPKRSDKSKFRRGNKYRSENDGIIRRGGYRL